MKSTQQPYTSDDIIYPNFIDAETEVLSKSQGHTAEKWSNLDLNPGLGLPSTCVNVITSQLGHPLFQSVESF